MNCSTWWVLDGGGRHGSVGVDVDKLKVIGGAVGVFLLGGILLLALLSKPTNEKVEVKTPQKNISLPDIHPLLRASLLVHAPDGKGSGVCVRSGGKIFVWTAAHVVEECQNVRKVADQVTGQEKVLVSYSDVRLSRDVLESGRKVGENSWLARIIRYSEHQKGEDLALLEMYSNEADVGSVQFLEEKDIPSLGEPILHIGSMAGEQGMNSLSEGIFGVAGRLRRSGRSDEFEGVIHDQVMLSALGGSSGGGVFRKRDSLCVGLVVCHIGGSDTVNAIIPARRMREYAKRANCLWAVDTSLDVPADVLGVPVNDVPVEIK